MYINNNYLTQVMEKPARRGDLLDLTLTNKEGLVGFLVKGCFSCSDYVELRILRGGNKVEARSQPWTVVSWIQKSRLQRALVG